MAHWKTVWEEAKPTRSDLLPAVTALSLGLLLLPAWHAWGLNHLMWGPADDLLGFGAWWLLFAFMWWIPIGITGDFIPRKALLTGIIGTGFFALRMDWLEGFSFLASGMPDWLRRLFFEVWQSSLLMVFLVAACWFLKDKDWAGLKPRGKLWPYWIMLMLMVPLVYWASLRPDFRAQYPKALYGSGIAADPASFNVKWLLIEMWYGLDFITIEWFFRGFFMWTMYRLIGRKAMWSMCLFYLTIHLGKPWPETLSSFFGGFILAVFGLHTRSIWGGVIVHMGIAWLMEWMVFL